MIPRTAVKYVVIDALEGASQQCKEQQRSAQNCTE